MKLSEVTLINEDNCSHNEFQECILEEGGGRKEERGFNEGKDEQSRLLILIQDLDHLILIVTAIWNTDKPRFNIISHHALKQKQFNRTRRETSAKYRDARTRSRSYSDKGHSFGF